MLRLLAVTVALSLLFAAIAFYTNQQRIEKEVVELAQLRINQFAQSIGDLLDAKEKLSPVVMEQRFDLFVGQSGRVVVSDGRFVLVRIYDPAGRKILDSADETFAVIPAVRQAVDDADIETLKFNYFSKCNPVRLLFRILSFFLSVFVSKKRQEIIFAFLTFKFGINP